MSLALACSLVPASALADVVSADEQLIAQDDVAQDLPELKVGAPLDVNKPDSADDEARVWYCRFVAPETAAYRFYSTGDQDTMGSLYSDMAHEDWINSGNDQGVDNMNFSFVASLEKDQVVYLEVSSDGKDAIICQVHADNVQGSTNNLEYATIFVNTPIFLQGAGVAFPEVSVFDALDNQLSENTDYTLAYYRRSVGEDGTPVYTQVTELTEPGDYYVQATAVEGGACTGASPYELVPVSSDYDLSVSEIELDQTSLPIVDGTAQLPKVSVTINGFEVPENGYKVVVYRAISGDDEQGEPVDPITEPGNYDLTIVPSEESNFFIPEGAVAPSWAIQVYEPSDISAAYMSPEGYVWYDFDDNGDIHYYYLFKGEPVEPQLYVSMPPATLGGDNRELKKDTDYTVVFENNDRPSTEGVRAVATLTGLSNYTGTKSVEFDLIEHIDLSTFLSSTGCELETGKGYATYVGEYQFDTLMLYTDGAALKPSVDFENRTDGDEYPKQGTDFEVSYRDADGNPVDELTGGSTYTIVLTAIAGGMCTGEASFPIEVRTATNLKGATVTLSRTSYTYNGFEKKPTVRSVVLDGVPLEENADYYVTYSKNKNAGTATALIHGILANGYCGTAKKTFKIAKAKQPMKAIGRITRLWSSKLAKKAQTIKRVKAVRIRQAEGTLSYKKATKAKKFKDWKVNAKTGVITVPKGTKKGTYKFPIKITAKGNTNYKAGSKTVTVQVRVK